jgi:hypothetical protein
MVYEEYRIVPQQAMQPAALDRTQNLNDIFRAADTEKRLLACQSASLQMAKSLVVAK